MSFFEGNPVKTFYSLSCKAAWFKAQKPDEVVNPHATGRGKK